MPETVKLYGARVHVGSGLVWQTIDVDPEERNNWLRRMGIFFTAENDNSSYMPTTKFERFTVDILPPNPGDQV